MQSKHFANDLGRLKEARRQQPQETSWFSLLIGLAFLTGSMSVVLHELVLIRKVQNMVRHFLDLKTKKCVRRQLGRIQMSLTSIQEISMVVTWHQQSGVFQPF